jgi:hypothetical protein
MLNFSYNLFTKCYQGNQTKDNVMGISGIPNGEGEKRTKKLSSLDIKIKAHQEGTCVKGGEGRY